MSEPRGGWGSGGPSKGLPVFRRRASSADWPGPETGASFLEQSQAAGGRQRGSLITEVAGPRDKDQPGSSRLQDELFWLWRQLLSWPVAVSAVTAVACDTLKSHKSKSVLADASLKCPHPQPAAGPLSPEEGTPGPGGARLLLGLPRGSGTMH